MAASTVMDQFFVEAMAPAAREDPYPLYDAYRTDHRLLRVADTMWLALSHEEVAALLRDPRLSSDERRATTKAGHEADGAALASRSLLFLDPPDHTRLRSLVVRGFTPSRVAALRPRVDALADGLLDEVAARAAADEVVDLVGALAHPLPMLVICALLGVPAADEHRFQTWSQALTRSLDPSILRSPADDAAIEAAEDALAAYLRDLLAARRARPGDDLLSALVAVEADGDRISEQELVDLTMLLLVAGHETTVNLIGNGVLALLGSPDQLVRLRRSPDLLPGAVDELLRFDAPVQLTQRIATEDLDLVGAPVRAGDELVLVLGAANRDPAAFPDPDALDVGRDARRHVGFGGGIHHCLGAALARVEAEVAIGGLLRRFGSIELAAPPARRPTLTLRGVATLPLALHR